MANKRMSGGKLTELGKLLAMFPIKSVFLYCHVLSCPNESDSNAEEFHGLISTVFYAECVQGYFSSISSILLSFLLLYPILFSILFYSIQSCSIPFPSILYYSILFYSILLNRSIFKSPRNTPSSPSSICSPRFAKMLVVAFRSGVLSHALSLVAILAER